MDLVFGLLSFLCLFVLAEKLHLPVIRNLMLHVVFHLNNTNLLLLLHMLMELDI